MPQLTIRGIQPELVSQVSKILIPELAEILATTCDNFTIDIISTTSFYLGRTVETFPFIEIGWFDRGQEIQDATASLVDKAFKQVGVPSLEIVFTIFNRTAYYADGQHY